MFRTIFSSRLDVDTSTVSFALKQETTSLSTNQFHLRPPLFVASLLTIHVPCRWSVSHVVTMTCEPEGGVAVLSSLAAWQRPTPKRPPSPGKPQAELPLLPTCVPPLWPPCLTLRSHVPKVEPFVSLCSWDSPVLSAPFTSSSAPGPSASSSGP